LYDVLLARLDELLAPGGTLLLTHSSLTDIPRTRQTLRRSGYAITGSRFTGTRLTDIRLKDVLFDGCRIDYATLRRVTAAGSVAFTDCTLTNGAWSSCRLPRIALRSCDLAGLELESCHLDGADLRGSRLHGLKTPLDNLRGVTLGEDQIPDLTHLTVAALDLTVRND
jgi:uncharacterized protein YjbI with pentapeptide repeats